MLIHNNRLKLSSSWYRKPTETDLTLNFHALAPFKYKKSVVISFIYRIFRSCSSWNNFHDGLNAARIILNKNQYPSSLVEDIIKNTLNNLLSVPKDDNASEISDTSESSIDSNAYLVQVANKDKFKFFINYRGKPTEQLARSFKKLNAPCNVIMTTKKMKFELPSLKPLVPRMLQSNVVYQISCPGCNSSYVGQTTRHLQRRFKEHTGNKGPVKTHFENCGIIPDQNIIKIIGKANTLAKLLTLEALFIKEICPLLNTKDEWRSRTLTLKF